MRTVTHPKSEFKRRQCMTITHETFWNETCFGVPQNPRHLIAPFKVNSKQIPLSRRTNLLSFATVLKIEADWRGRSLYKHHEAYEDQSIFKFQNVPSTVGFRGLGHIVRFSRSGRCTQKQTMRRPMCSSLGCSPVGPLGGVLAERSSRGFEGIAVGARESTVSRRETFSATTLHVHLHPNALASQTSNCHILRTTERICNLRS